MKKDINKIAIIRLSALGDIVNTAIVLQFIHKAYPKAKIDWVCEEVFAPLLQNHPLINKVHSVNLKELKKTKSISKLFENISKLRNLDNYDIVIDVQGLLKSAIVAKIVGKNTYGFAFDSARERVAALFYKGSCRVAYDENIVKRNTFLIGEALRFRISDEMILDKEPLFEVEKYGDIAEDKKNIAIVIGASWESKKYPKQSVAKLCDELKESCYIIWGDEKEKKEAQWICENSSYAALAPKLSLNELLSFISSMDLLIGNDTGPTHMAWAQNIPSITLFGPTNSRMMYKTPLHVSIKSPSRVDIFKIDKNDFSIKEIKVSEILMMAKRLLYGL